MDDPGLIGRHRGRRPSDLDWLEHHHGDRYLPRHGDARHVPRSLCREVAHLLLAVAVEQANPSA